MCNLSQGIKEEGRLEGKAEGKAEGKLEMALNIVKTYVEEQKITVLQAMDLLRIPNELRAAIQEQLDSEKIRTIKSRQDASIRCVLFLLIQALIQYKGACAHSARWKHATLIV